MSCDRSLPATFHLLRPTKLTKAVNTSMLSVSESEELTSAAVFALCTVLILPYLPFLLGQSQQKWPA